MVSPRENVIRYSIDDVVDHDDGRVLKVELAGEELFLPALIIGEKVIFILDPNKKEIRSAGQKALLSLLEETPEIVKNNGTAIRFITPESSKSTAMIEGVRDLLADKTNQEIRLDPGMFLKGKKDGVREELEDRLGNDSLIVDYSPITKNSSFIGISKKDAEVLQQEIESGTRLVILDDVISTGGTVLAIQELLEMIMDKPMTDILTLAVAREGKEDFSFDEDPLNWLYPIFIPELMAGKA